MADPFSLAVLAPLGPLVGPRGLPCWGLMLFCKEKKGTNPCGHWPLSHPKNFAHAACTQPSCLAPCFLGCEGVCLQHPPDCPWTASGFSPLVDCVPHVASSLLTGCLLYQWEWCSVQITPQLPFSWSTVFKENYGVRREEEFQHLLPCGPSLLRGLCKPEPGQRGLPSLVVHLVGLWWQWDLEVPLTCILF